MEWAPIPSLERIFVPQLMHSQIVTRIEAGEAIRLAPRMMWAAKKRAD
jgi:hypothetical protein